MINNNGLGVINIIFNKDRVGKIDIFLIHGSKG
jgi:hypothetical protein